MFETMAAASDYRELVTQQLRQGMADIITLDLGRISSKGITSGSSFQVPLSCSTSCCLVEDERVRARGHSNGVMDQAWQHALISGCKSPVIRM